MAATIDVTGTLLPAGQVLWMLNMAGGLPEAVIRPVTELAALAAGAVAKRPGEVLACAPSRTGPVLRGLVAARVAVPGPFLRRENVLIATGGTQALDLIGKILL